APDRGAVGDRLGLRPRPEPVAERVHVGVRADARVAKQVPRAAEALARLEDRVRLAGTAVLQVVRGADAGQPGADDQHVEVVEDRIGGSGHARTLSTLRRYCQHYVERVDVV